MDLRTALRQRLRLPSGEVSGQSEFAAAAKHCLSAGLTADASRRALRRFEDACATLVDRGVLQAPRDNAVLTEIAACGGETATAMPAAACRRAWDAIGRAVASRTVAAASELRHRVASVAGGGSGTTATDALNVGGDVEAILEQLSLLEDVDAVLQPGGASGGGNVAAALRSQATALLHADLPRSVVASGLAFWLQLIEHRVAAIVP